MIKKPNKDFVLPGLILVLALIFRLVLINQSFWLDEAAQALESTRNLSAQFDLSADFQPPLFHLLVHLLSYFSKADWFLRLASVTPGLLTVWYTLKLGEILYSKKVALLAGLLLALSQFHVFYSQELRPYSLATFFAIYSFYELIRYRQTKHKIHLIKLTLINTLGCFTMYLYPLWILAEIIYYPPIGLSLLANLLMFLPWLPSFLGQLKVGSGLLASLPGWSTSVSPSLLKMLPLTLIKLTLGRITVDPIPRDFLILLVLGTALGYLCLKSVRQSLWLLFFVPIGLALLISVKIPILDPKRVLFVLPIFSLLVSSGVKSKLTGLAYLTVIIVSLTSLVRYWFDPQEQREPWKTAVASIASLADKKTLVMFAFPEPFAPWRWYASPDIHTVAFVPIDLTAAALTSRLQSTHQYDTVITFDYLRDLTDPKHEQTGFLETHGYEARFLKAYPGIGFIRFYTRGEAFAYTRR